MGDAQGGLLGQLAVHYKLISAEQLATAGQFQGQYPNKSFGDILLGLGYVNQGQLAQLMQAEKQTRQKMAEAKGTAPAAKSPQTQQQAAPARPAVPAAGTSQGTPLQTANPQGISATPSQPPKVASSQPGGPAPIAIDLPDSADEPFTIEPTVPGGGTGTTKEAAMRQSSASIPTPVQSSTGGNIDPAKSRDEFLQSATGDHVDRKSLAYLYGILKNGAEAGASDIHLHSGSNVRMRQFTRLTNLTDSALDSDQCEKVLISSLNNDEYHRFKETGEVDFAMSMPGVGRFRACVYRQHGGCDGVFHFIPESPPSLTGLGLPDDISKLTDYHQGLVLVTGPAGCGKSSTLAALVNLLNKDRSEHILTVEDPIEYVHTSNNSLVNQRQVKRHTESFARALRAALREDPDVICIGEMRDLETISLALSAAETGHLVLGTLHTNNAVRTINRIIGAYPPSQQSQIRTMLSESLRAILSQRLMPSKDEKGVVLGYELLLVNTAVSNLIRENRAFQILSVLQTGAAQGMQLLDNNLRELVKSGKISLETARANAESPANFAK